MRLPIQEIKDLNVIREFLKENRFMMLSVVDGEGPYTVPLNYGFVLEEDGELNLYVHTSKGGRLYEVLHRSDLQKGVKASFAIAVMNGVLESIKGACEWDISYRSVIGEGTLTELLDREEKSEALSVLMESFGAGRDFKFPRIDGTIVYRIHIDDYSMKRSKQDFAPADHPHRKSV